MNSDSLPVIEDAVLENVSGGDSLIALLDLSGVLSGLGVLGNGGNNPTSTNKAPSLLGFLTGGLLG